MEEASETSEEFSDLHRKRRIAPDELYLEAIKLEKLGVSKTKIDEVKE